MKRFAKRLVRRIGWELRYADPNHSIDAFLAQLLSRCGINAVLDVGARNGEYGRLLRDLVYPLAHRII